MIGGDWYGVYHLPPGPPSPPHSPAMALTAIDAACSVLPIEAGVTLVHSATRARRRRTWVPETTSSCLPRVFPDIATSSVGGRRRRDRPLP